ncbi:hypothetical protein CALCODRAFT_62275 [Calocera cornea HHB12733]|uniref:Uncharacterized protein n=1 Tax=Calocera cornea HHB12733 TaxID=1353952 RepID=A0A165DLV7_9BASI|nr:hypothetical protein CALCODRAFT_62275 [Calocera cornea HHB12733]
MTGSPVILPSVGPYCGAPPEAARQPGNRQLMDSAAASPPQHLLRTAWQQPTIAPIPARRLG